MVFTTVFQPLHKLLASTAALTFEPHLHFALKIFLFFLKEKSSNSIASHAHKQVVKLISLGSDAESEQVPRDLHDFCLVKNDYS